MFLHLWMNWLCYRLDSKGIVICSKDLGLFHRVNIQTDNHKIDSYIAHWHESLRAFITGIALTKLDSYA